MTKMYVGNLPFSMDESAVRALFEKHGAVQSVALINDRDTGRPRGFGFVEMASADAASAMQALNGHDVDGRALKVNEAQERTGGGGGGGGGGSRGPKRWYQRSSFVRELGPQRCGPSRLRADESCDQGFGAIRVYALARFAYNRGPRRRHSCGFEPVCCDG